MTGARTIGKWGIRAMAKTADLYQELRQGQTPPQAVVCPMCGQPTGASLLQRLRIAKGRTLDQAAADLNMAKSNIWQIERGEGNPRMTTIQKLAAYYGVSVGEIAESLAQQPMTTKGADAHDAPPA